MIRRLAFILAALLASCASTPAYAQEQSMTPTTAIEPPPQPGTVAIRIANTTDCPMAVRVKRDGKAIGIALVPAHALQWAHATPHESVFEVEILVAEKLCGVSLPTRPSVRDSSRTLPIWAGSRSPATRIRAS